MVKILEAFKFNQKISLKSRLLLGIFLIIYLSFFVYQFQSIIDEGDKVIGKVGHGTYEDVYAYGFDDYTTRDVVVKTQQETLILFILPILILLLKNRIFAYTLTLLTIVLSIWIYSLTILYLIFYFMIPLLIVISMTLIWESKKNNVANANVPILILLLNNRILASILILLIIAILMLLYIFGIIYLIIYFLISLIAIFIILIWELKKWKSKKK